MPIYEFRCPKGHTFETFQRMSDPPPTECPACGAAPVEKILFPVAVHFKGSGFYSTDYGKGKRKSAAAESDGGPSAEKPADKPAEKASTGETKKPTTGGES